MRSEKEVELSRKKKKTEVRWVGGERSFSFSRERERKVISVQKIALGSFPLFEGGKLFFVFVYFFQLDALAREESFLAREKSDICVVVQNLVKVHRVFIDGKGGKCKEWGWKSFPWK